ncbi:anti-phage dCTP deaminase [Aquimarina algiphila]|uniref:anti-phage dCTP deaminase n=1 Tax=Aquimarina algiphila TaxID=2047982 RepID=UPI002330AAA1|nr:anti-phage dCTP deaminase [Aquimarina algiphila]
MEAEKLQHENKNVGRTTREKVNNTLTEELFFGICAPIGSLKKEVITSLSTIIKDKYNYEVECIKLSEFIKKYKINKSEALKEKTKAYSDLIYKIKEGNEIRKKYHNNSVLVELAIQDIHISRLEEINLDDPNELNPTKFKSRRKCYIFDSIKNKEELLLLRRIYTKNFFQFSVFSPMDERKNTLLNKDLSQSEVDNIVEIDEFENNDFGQNVRGTFSQGDFFLRVSHNNLDKLSSKIERYLNLIFESDIITPTIEETAMYSAKSAAGNSACLSRQVGASITDDKGDVISIGWNDVPKFGGNLYREGNQLDVRCKHKGYCSNDNQKDLLVEKVIESIKNDEELKTILNDKNGFLDITIIDKLKKNLRNSKIKDLIEFSRSVHAEMHAIISGSQLSGSKMVNGKLFCTTYPCHNCARHIIVAGIKEVYYIEPYVKSLCLTLHDDAITEDEKSSDKVRILIFDGVAPRNYLTFFTNFVERKNNGKLIKVDFKTVKPKISKSLQALPTLEQQAIHSLKECGLING